MKFTFKMWTMILYLPNLAPRPRKRNTLILEFSINLSWDVLAFVSERKSPIPAPRSFGRQRWKHVLSGRRQKVKVWQSGAPGAAGKWAWSWCCWTLECYYPLHIPLVQLCVNHNDSQQGWTVTATVSWVTSATKSQNTEVPNTIFRHEQIVNECPS